MEIRPDKKGCIIKHREKVKYSKADLYVAKGFYKKVGELHGLKVTKCEFLLLRDGAVFKLEWA